jgi:hypothetical protein
MDRTISKLAEGHRDVAVEPPSEAIVHEGAAQRLRAACDGMGALLRFRLHG